MCTYESIIPFKRIPYWLFWIFVGIITFISGELLFSSLNAQPFWALEIFMASATAIWPIAFIYLAHTFREIMQELSQVLWSNIGEFETWLAARERRIFTLQSTWAKVVTGSITIAGPVTMLILGVPFQNDWLNILIIVAFASFSFIGGQGCYICLDLLLTLAELSQRQVKVPFFRLPHPAINRLQSYYSIAAVGITISYSGLALAIWQSPYKLAPILLLWLAILAFYPMAMFFWSIYQVHKLVQKAKQSHLEIANKQIQLVLQKITDENDTSVFEHLAKAIDVQTKVQSIREWPFTISGAITFFITTTSAVVQTVITVLATFKP